jgi:hypothetical protein
MYPATLRTRVLTPADLEVNVLEFRQRSFQFDHLVELHGTEFAVFSRTETESESQFRPRIVHLRVVVPRSWIVYDETNELLSLAKDGVTVPVRLSAPVVEVRAERPEFTEQGIAWQRAERAGGPLVYAPAEFAEQVLAPEGLSALGVS